MSGGVALALAEFVATFKPADVPGPTRESAKRCLLDLLGAAVAGYPADAARAYREVALGTFAAGAARVWFAAARRRAAGAALANSAAASALDLDDGHRAAAGHPGAAIIPAAIAVAEESGADASELLTAIVLGYEVAIRVAAARDFTSLDTVSSGRWCPFGVAAAAGWLRRLSPDRLARALVIGGYQAPLLAPTGRSAHHIKEGIPWATLTGLGAVGLAEQGFGGPRDLLDRAPYFDGPRILEGLGATYAIDGVYLKPYACCRWIHPAIDALLALQAEHGLTVTDITGIDVFTFQRALNLANDPDPQSLETAQFSFPFCLALAAIEGAGALQLLSTRSLGRADLVAFGRRVALHRDPTLDAIFPGRAPARVVLDTRRGRFERRVDEPRGDPANPMDRAELRAKFHRLAGGAWSPAILEQTIQAVLDLEDTDLLRLLDQLGRAAPR